MGRGEKGRGLDGGMGRFERGGVRGGVTAQGVNGGGGGGGLRLKGGGGGLREVGGVRVGEEVIGEWVRFHGWVWRRRRRGGGRGVWWDGGDAVAGWAVLNGVQLDGSGDRCVCARGAARVLFSFLVILLVWCRFTAHVMQ